MKCFVFVAFVVAGCAAPDAKVTTSEVREADLEKYSAVDACLKLSRNQMQSGLGLLQDANKDTYEGGIRELLEDNCVSCHQGATPPNLLGFAGASRNAAASLAAILADRMPPGAPFSATQKEAFQAWITAGTPQGSKPSIPAPAPTVESPIGSESAEADTSSSTNSKADTGVGAEPSEVESVSSTEDDGKSCVDVGTRDECRARGYLWNGLECIPAKRIDCKIEQIVSAFAASGMDVQPSLVLPEGGRDLRVEGCSEIKAAVGSEIKLVPIAVIKYQTEGDSLVYRTLSIDP